MIIGERASRVQLLKLAKQRNCHDEVKHILKKYDKILAKVTNPSERHAIAAEGLTLIHNYLSLDGELIVNGVRVK